jgi:hypothetical protein
MGRNQMPWGRTGRRLERGELCFYTSGLEDESKTNTRVIVETRKMPIQRNLEGRWPGRFYKINRMSVGRMLRV